MTRDRSDRKTSSVLEILHQDTDIVAINKPPALAVIPGRGETDSVIERLARQLDLPCSGRADPRLRVVHRLDKDTTGVLLFARHVAAQRALSHQFQNNQVQKEYVALVNGKIAEDEGTIDAPIWNHPTDRERMAVAKKGGRPAISAWRVEHRMKRFTVVRVFPKTGKTHQIRVHMAHIGHTLAIDPIYGSGEPLFLSQHKRNYRPTKGEEERPLMSRLTLHAHKLSFVHPDGQPLTLEAAMPKDFRATIAQLSKT